jgi:RNase H-fold protein (predicted Holliday junction resolvase)
VILAIDPGTSKIGWALVDNLGKVEHQGIAHIGQWDGQLQSLAARYRIETVVVGDGTNRVNMATGATRLLPQAEIVVIDETGSTVEAWKLKRTQEAGRNPFKILQFTLRQLFSPQPVDDYAARVLALRHLKRQK